MPLIVFQICRHSTRVPQEREEANQETGTCCLFFGSCMLATAPQPVCQRLHSHLLPALIETNRDRAGELPCPVVPTPADSRLWRIVLSVVRGLQLEKCRQFVCSPALGRKRALVPSSEGGIARLYSGMRFCPHPRRSPACGRGNLLNRFPLSF